jgi:hypothetical protein
MRCLTAATKNGFSRAGLTLLLPRIGTFASLHGSRQRRWADDVWTKCQTRGWLRILYSARIAAGRNIASENRARIESVGEH